MNRSEATAAASQDRNRVFPHVTLFCSDDIIHHLIIVQSQPGKSTSVGNKHSGVRNYGVFPLPPSLRSLWTIKVETSTWIDETSASSSH